jgi:hypothetical protein
MRKFSLLALLFSAIIVLSGCLTAQYKEYKFNFTGKNTGTLTVTHRNIFSQIYSDEDADSVLNSDFAELLSSYLEGTTLEEKFPDAKVVSKKLYEENGQLCGEIVFEFTDIAQVNLFQYDKKAPFQFYIPSDEEYFDTNGEKPATYMPVVFWDKKLKSLEVTTTISTPEETDQSLLTTWKNNK